MSARLPVLSILCSCLGLAACGTPPEENLGQVQLALVRNNTVFKATQVFQVHIVKATTVSGASVTCNDIPANFRPGDQMLVPVDGSPHNLPWKGEKNEATVEKMVVPPGEKLVVIVKALAQWSKGIHTVGMACQDNLNFAAGSSQTITLTMKPTTGALCTVGGNECEQPLVCQTGQFFPGGYCLKVACAGDQDCPPGSTCITDDTSGNLCLAKCEGITDCNTAKPQTQICEGRLGPTSGGCGSVCLYPLYSVANKCP